MNRWLTWRARLAHLLCPEIACLCHVCALERARFVKQLVAAAGVTESTSRKDLCPPKT